MSGDVLRSGHVLLGIPYGASSDAAAAAFARKARGLRRQPRGAERLQDLTWALNQVESINRDPALAAETYRVPADPEALLPSGPGVLAPRPVGATRRTTHADEWVDLLAVAAIEALSTARADLARAAAVPPL